MPVYGKEDTEMKWSMNLLNIFKVGVLLLATLMYAAGAAVKGPHGPPLRGDSFTGYSALCEILDMGTYEEVGGIGMLRDAELRYRVETDSPYMTGWHTMSMNYDQHLKSGRGTSWGEGVLEPDTYDGTFKEVYAIKSTHFVWHIYGTFIGNDELEGILVDYAATPLDEVPELVEGFCGDDPVLGAEIFRGVIHVPE